MTRLPRKFAWRILLSTKIMGVQFSDLVLECGAGVGGALAVLAEECSPGSSFQNSGRQLLLKTLLGGVGGLVVAAAVVCVTKAHSNVCVCQGLFA